jgi:hypothetical protein
MARLIRLLLNLHKKRLEKQIRNDKFDHELSLRLDAIQNFLEAS